MYDAVTTLYGISVKNVPVAGVIGCPFWCVSLWQTALLPVDSPTHSLRLFRPPSEGQEHVVVWGCVGVGVFGLPPPPV